MKQLDQQKGGGLEVITITLLSVIVIGALGFIFWQNVINKDSRNNSNVHNLNDSDIKSSDKKTDSSNNTKLKTVVLEQWSVSFPLNNSDIQFNYVDEYGGYYDVVTRIENCFPSMPYLTSLGRINRWNKDGEAGFENVTPLVSVDNYNFTFSSPQQACGDPGTADGRKANEMQENLMHEVTSALLELVKAR